MIRKTIHIDDLRGYLRDTFKGDDDLVRYFDPGCVVTDWEECCEVIFEKIRLNYPTATIRGVVHFDSPIGYYVLEKDLLISFGLHPDYRKADYLRPFWNLIKEEFTGPFSCVLYANNTRAISWLQKAGMNILFDNVTILTCPQED